MRTAQNYNNSVSTNTPDQILQACFQHYFRSFQNTYEPIKWYNLFREDVYAKLERLFGLTQDQTEYLLRSSNFVDFACDYQGIQRPERTFIVMPINQC